MKPVKVTLHALVQVPIPYGHENTYEFRQERVLLQNTPGEVIRYSEEFATQVALDVRKSVALEAKLRAEREARAKAVAESEKQEAPF